MAGYQWPYKWLWRRGKPREGYQVQYDAWEREDLLVNPGPHNPDPLKVLAEQFRDQRRRLRDRLQKTAPAETSDEQQELLRSLGYLGGAEP